MSNAIDRAALERDAVRQAVRDAGHGHLLLSEEALERSLRTTLAGRPRDEPVRIFAYGSLIWSPMIRIARRAVARVHGYHRGLYLWSRINRGSPERPGLVLALDRGGSVAGLVLELEESAMASELAVLWRREMIMGSYRPAWVRASCDGRSVSAIAFVIDRTLPTYAGRLSEPAVLEVLRSARGQYGACADYVTETAASLERHGIPDRHLARLARRLRDGC